MNDPTRFVSTGGLPQPDAVQRLIDEAHAAFQEVRDGEVSRVYPALADASPDEFGVALAGVSGRIYEVGDARREFSIMSISKPFVFALVCDEHGVDGVRERIGVNATGRAFNSVAAIEEGDDGRTNPMVNPGAIATSSLAPGDGPERRWEFLRAGLSAFAGRELELNERVFHSASATNHRNQSMARLLQVYGRVYRDPAESVDLYTRQCSLNVSARDLAVMGATLADGGLNPVTGRQVVSAESARDALVVMATAGLYETSGDWLFDIGLPGKSGIGGGIVTVSPGKGGLGTYSAPLDAAGNSVRGQRTARLLSIRLGLDLFASTAASRDPSATKS